VSVFLNDQDGVFIVLILRHVDYFQLGIQCLIYSSAFGKEALTGLCLWQLMTLPEMQSASI
jgi:hypothetical protein